MRLSRADTLFRKGNIQCAIDAYNIILSKHELAAAHLANVYFTEGRLSATSALNWFNKIYSLPSLMDKGFEYDKDAYNRVLNNTLRYVVLQATSFFNGKNYMQASVYINSVVSYILHDVHYTALYYKYNTFNKLDGIFTKKPYTPIICELKNFLDKSSSKDFLEVEIAAFCDKKTINEHLYKRAIDVLTVLYSKGLNDSKNIRSYAKSILLYKDAEYHSESDIKNFAIEIAKSIDAIDDEKNKFVLYREFASYESSLGKEFTGRAILLIKAAQQTDSDIAMERLDDYWGVLPSVEYFKNFIIEGSPLQNAAIEHIIAKHSVFLSSPEFYETFVSIVLSINEAKSIEILEKLHQRGYDVTDKYVNKILGIVSISDNEKGIALLDRAISQLKDDRLLLAKGELLIKSSEKVENLDSKYSILLSVIELDYENTLNPVQFEAVKKCLLLSDLFFSAGRVLEATDICDKMSKYDILAVIKYIEIQLKFSDSLDDVKGKIDCMVTTLNYIHSCKYEYASIQLVDSAGLLEILSNNLEKSRYEYAEQLEESNNFLLAKEQYDVIRDSTSKNGNITLADIRYFICVLKSNQQSICEESKAINNVLKCAEESCLMARNELAYRYAIYLLENGQADESLSIIDAYIPEEIQLRDVCNDLIIQKSQDVFKKINDTIERMNNMTLSVSEGVLFFNRMAKLVKAISPVTNFTKKDVVSYKRYVLDYLISKSFDDENYCVCIKAIKLRYPDYLNDPLALRNLATACLGAAENNMLDAENYKEIISIWLTAIYHEGLFVKSLDYTKWDDPYTFTLKYAYGLFDELTYEVLPPNVNFDSPNESNISIKEVQKNLLERFEVAISDNQEYIAFFAEQKNALDAVIDLNLKDKFNLVAPYIALLNDKSKSDVEHSLNEEVDDFYCNNWEHVVKVGEMYGLDYGDYHDYKLSRDYVFSCKEAVDKGSIVLLRKSFLEEKMDLVRKFSEMFASLSSYLMTKFQALVAAETKFEKIYKVFVIINSSMRDDDLNFAFANYVNRHIVSSINAGDMSFSEGRDLLAKIKEYDSDNPRLDKMLSDIYWAEINSKLKKLLTT